MQRYTYVIIKKKINRCCKSKTIENHKVLFFRYLSLLIIYQLNLNTHCESNVIERTVSLEYAQYAWSMRDTSESCAMCSNVFCVCEREKHVSKDKKNKENTPYRPRQNTLRGLLGMLLGEIINGFSPAHAQFAFFREIGRAYFIGLAGIICGYSVTVSFYIYEIYP